MFNQKSGFYPQRGEWGGMLPVSYRDHSTMDLSFLNGFHNSFIIPTNGIKIWMGITFLLEIQIPKGEITSVAQWLSNYQNLFLEMGTLSPPHFSFLQTENLYPSHTLLEFEQSGETP